MSFINRIKIFFKKVLALFGPPPLEDSTPPRDPFRDPLSGDVFQGPNGGEKVFLHFDEEWEEVVFRRATRKGLCREPIGKWFVWLKNAKFVRSSITRVGEEVSSATHRA